MNFIDRYVMTYPKQYRNLKKELLFSVFASIYLGFGFFFFLLSFGLNL